MPHSFGRFPTGLCSASVVASDGAQPDGFAGGGQGGFVGFVQGHEAGDNRPELGGVVGFMEMGQLMHKDVVDEAWGELEGGPVDIDVL